MKGNFRPEKSSLPTGMLGNGSFGSIESNEHGGIIGGKADLMADGIWESVFSIAPGISEGFVSKLNAFSIPPKSGLDTILKALLIELGTGFGIIFAASWNGLLKAFPIDESRPG